MRHRIISVLILTIFISSTSIAHFSEESADSDERPLIGGQENSILEGARLTMAYHPATCAIVEGNEIRCGIYSNPDASLLVTPYNTTFTELASSGVGGLNICGIVDQSDYYFKGAVLCWTPEIVGGDEGAEIDFTHLYPTKVAVSLTGNRDGICAIDDNGMLFGFCYYLDSDTSYLSVSANWYRGQDNICGLMSNFTIHCRMPDFGGSTRSVYYPYDIFQSYDGDIEGDGAYNNLSISISKGANHICWNYISYSDSWSLLTCRGFYVETSSGNKHNLNTHLDDVIAFSSGEKHSCAIIINGSVICWGDNYYGQLGQESSWRNDWTIPRHSGTPIHVNLPEGVVASAVYTSNDETCIVSSLGDLFCWGGDSDDAPIHQVDFGKKISLMNIDSDNDGIINALDFCSQGNSNWDSNESTDYDNDGCKDNLEDSDDDNDGIHDYNDLCSQSILDWRIGLSYDEYIEYLDRRDWSEGALPSTLDTDNDGCHNFEDMDDDNDGYSDTEDVLPFDSIDWLDNDNDGSDCHWWEFSSPTHCGGDNRDTDDDNDGWSDSWEIICLTNQFDETSIPVNSDGDYYTRYQNLTEIYSLINNSANSGGIGCDVTDIDDDNDGYLDDLDDFPVDRYEWLDTDSDGIGDNADEDDDNDGYSDWNDTFPLDPSEWLDSDNDSIGNNEDDDDDGDNYSDIIESECDSNPLNSSITPTDNDLDSICDSLDEDDDNDGWDDIIDSFPLDNSEWSDFDSDGMGDNIDPDDDNDGINDHVDAYPLDGNRYLSESKDNDNYNNLMIPILLVVISVLLIVIVISIRGNRKKNVSSESQSKESTDINNS